MKKIAIIVFFLVLNACSGNKLIEGPAPHSITTQVDGPPEYQAGWKDGCESGLATYGPVHYKMYYNFYQNYSMMKSVPYVHGWHEAYDYCRWFDLKYQTTGEENLLSADLLVKFLPSPHGPLPLAKIYANTLGDKTPIFERVQGGFMPSEKFSDNFRRGWEDGCDTGRTVYGSDNYKSIQAARGRSFKRDTTKIGDREYEAAWWDGINYCRQHLNTHEGNWDEDWYGLLELK